jgi:tRNA 2-thiocytidine biosynthesis protein TtcA
VKSILSASENRRIGQAMLDYAMLADRDRVLVAVSGGIDSLVLAWVLANWHRKAPISYELQAIHIGMDPNQVDDPAGTAAQVVAGLAGLGLSCKVLPAELPAPAQENSVDRQDVCFRCARSRRRQLFEYARQEQYTTLALGHHRDDIVETFFINLTCSGNISTMRPKQDLFSNRLSLIRPLAYLKKDEISSIGERLALQAVASRCPLSGQTRRQDVRGLLEHVYQQIPGSRNHIFAALGNVRQDYLLNQENNADKS